MAAIFLSASVPVQGRAGFETAEPYLIREAVSALVEVVVGRKLLVWGGHPAITPMIWASAEGLDIDYGQSVRLFQSSYFEDRYPEDNVRFGNVTFVDGDGERETSLKLMRVKMLSSYKYEAAVFIGGMEGIRLELDLYRELNPKTKIIAIPSPGGVALEIYNELEVLPVELRNAIDYSAWFYRLLDIRTTDERNTDKLELEARRQVG